MKTYNQDFYEIFNEIAELLALLGENPFRIRAYQNAARMLKEAPPITKKNANKARFQELPGIGEDLSNKMMEYIKSGKVEFLEKIRKQIPEAVRNLLKIPHLGPRRVRDLYINLGIKSTEDLKKAAASGEIDELPGFGPKLIQQIMDAIEKGQEKKRRHDRKVIEPIVKKLVQILQKTKGIEKVEVAGSYRRLASDVGDIDILVQGDSAELALKNIQKTFKDITILGQGETKLSFVIFHDNLQVDIRFVPADSWGAALLYFTGNKDYNVMMRKVAIDKGYLLNEYGLFDNGEYIAGKTEEEVYKKLDLKPVEPKNRK